MAKEPTMEEMYRRLGLSQVWDRMPSEDLTRVVSVLLDRIEALEAEVRANAAKGAGRG